MREMDQAMIAQRVQAGMGKQRSLGEPEKALAPQTQGVREGCPEEGLIPGL